MKLRPRNLEKTRETFQYQIYRNGSEYLLEDLLDFSHAVDESHSASEFEIGSDEHSSLERSPESIKSVDKVKSSSLNFKEILEEQAFCCDACTHGDKF